MKDLIFEKLKAILLRMWEMLVKKWDTESTEGRIKLVGVLIVILFIAWSMFFGKAQASDKLGANIPVTFVYAGPAVSMIDGKTEPGGLIGIRHNWYPVDFVAEGIVREAGSANVMAARTWGDFRYMGGISFQGGANKPGLVFGVDLKRFSLRIVTFDATSETPEFCSGRRWRRVCTPAVIENTSHSAVTLAYTFPLGSR